MDRVVHVTEYTDDGAVTTRALSLPSEGVTLVFEGVAH